MPCPHCMPWSTQATVDPRAASPCRIARACALHLQLMDDLVVYAVQDALGERYREPPKSMAAAAAQAWLPIRRGTLDFDTRAVKASVVETITHSASHLVLGIMNAAHQHACH